MRFEYRSTGKIFVNSDGRKFHVIQVYNEGKPTNEFIPEPLHRPYAWVDGVFTGESREDQPQLWPWEGRILMRGFKQGYLARFLPRTNC